MPQTRPNKVTVPVNSDAWNLANDLATLGDTANVVIPVANQTERDALTKKLGLAVSRADLNGLIEVCDGTTWRSPTKIRHAEWLNNGSFTVNANASWDIGALTASANTFNNTFSNATGTLSGQVNITETGVYAIHMRIVPSSDPGLSHSTLVSSSGTTYAEAVNQGGTGNGLWEWDTYLSNKYIVAGDKIRGTLRTSNATTISASMTITKLQG